MKKLFAILLFLPMFVGAQTTYYVDSLSGNDTHAGTSQATAWKSNAKVTATSFSSTDTLRFKRPYHYTGFLSANTLALVGAYGSGADPMVDGFAILATGSWTNLGGNVWSVTCSSCSPNLNAVTLDGVLQQIARSPNSTYNTFASFGSSTQITGTGLINPPDYTGTQLVIRTGHPIIDRLTVISSPTGTINFAPAATCTTCGGNGFFLQNNAAFLDLVGEWTFDPATHILKMYLPSGPTGHVIQASTIDTLCSMNGGSTSIDNVQFQGGNMINVLAKNGTNRVFSNIHSTLGGGVAFYSTSETNPSFINDTIDYFLSNAVYNLTASGTSNINNNIIHDIGMIPGMGLSGSGATYEAIASGSKSVISFNNIYTIGYIPIYTTGDSSQVHDNIIHDYCYVKDDGGAVYIWDPTSIYYPNQRKVLNNIIYNGHLAPGGVVDGSPAWGGAAVYLDSHAKDVLVDGNTIYNNYTGFFDHADSNTVTNNIFSGNIYAQTNIAQVAGLLIRGINIQNNTFRNYLIGQKIFSATSTANDINSFGVVNNNSYYFDHGDLTAFYTFRTGTDAGTNRSFASWQSNTGFDANSTTSLLYPYTIKDTVIGGWNARIAYVANYPDSMPCIISFLGLGEVGTDTTKLGLNTYSYWMQHGRFGAVQLGNGTHYPVYVTLQLTTGSATAITNPQIKSRVDAILSRWKIKKGALFMTGYSNGGRRALEYIAYQPTAGDHSYAISVRAVIGIVSEKPGDIPPGGTPAYPQNMVEAAKAGSKLLGFDQIGDGGRDMGTYTKKMNDTVPGSVVYIRSQAGDHSHSCCFNTFYDSTQIWNSSNTNINAKPYGNYPNTDGVTWLLRQGDTSLNSAGNVAPTANAGADQSITLPTSTGNLDASGSFPNGGAVIASYKWIKISGPSTFTITNDALVTTTVTGLVQGTYVFQVMVTDNNSLTATDQVTIVVVAASNIPPTANAGANQTITQPAASLPLNGSATDPDGTIATYLWEQEAGASANILTPGSATTVINNLAPGLYTFRLTVTDNGGATAFDEMQVTVVANGTGTEKVYQVSIARYQTSYDTLWQRWKTDSAKSFNPRRTTGETSTVLITITGQLDTVRDNGPNYALNITGMSVPRGAIREVSYSTVPLGVQISGLDPQKLYTVIFGSSRAGASPTLITTFKSSQSSDTFDIQANNNYNTEALFSNLVPTSLAVLNFTANKKAGTPGAYIDYIILKEQGAAINTAPSAFAGLDQLISAPLDSVIVHGLGTDPDDDDSVVKWKWSGTGPNGNFTIVTPDSATTKIIGLDSPGTYQFTLTVTDTHGSTGTDFMTIVVTASTGSISLVAPAYMRVARQQFNGRGPTQTRDTTFGYLSCTPGPNATSIQWVFIAGPATVRFDDSLAANTRVWDLIPGDYLFKVIARNVTDTAFAYVQIKSTDWQTKNEYGCNNGTPRVIDVFATSPTALIKTNFSDQYFVQTGYRILGNDIIILHRNTLNGGVYQDLQFGGVSGGEGCPLQIIADTTIDVSRRIFWAFGNDSSAITHANIDGRIPSKGILYGFVTKGAGGSKGNFGLTCNLCAYDSIMGHYSDSVEVAIFVKNNQDSTHPVTIFNQFRFYKMFIGYNMFHSTGVGESAYLGNTSPNGIISIGGNKGPSTRLDTLTFYRNYTGNAWLDGGQMVTAQVIYNIENWYPLTGRMNQSSQRFVTDAGGANYVKIIGNFGYLGRDGLGDLAHGNNEVAYNYMGRMNNAGVGTGSYTFQFFPEAWGHMTGSALLEDIGQDSGYVDMHHNIADAPEIQGFRIYDPRNALSKLHPSLLRNNAAVDTLGRTVSQLFSNVSGAPYTYSNTVFTSRPLQVVDLSTQFIGPKFLLYWPADGTSAIFTNSRDAFDWYWNKLYPPTVIDCKCVRISTITP